jgi:hypothetical protein
MPHHSLLRSAIGEHLQLHFRRHGLTVRVGRRALDGWLPKKRRPKPEANLDGVPVTPNHPTDLSGGAEADLNFDD